MTYKITHDPESGAFYVRLREGEYAETIPLSDDPGLGAGADVDADGNVLGLEFLSFEEFAGLLADGGGSLEIPERVSPPGEGRRRATVLMRWGSLEAGARPDAEAVRVAVSSLAPGDQELLRLRFFEGLEMDDVAARLGSSSASATQQLRMALRRLRKLLDERGEASEVDVEELEELLARS